MKILIALLVVLAMTACSKKVLPKESCITTSGKSGVVCAIPQ